MAETPTPLSASESLEGLEVDFLRVSCPLSRLMSPLQGGEGRGEGRKKQLEDKEHKFKGQGRKEREINKIISQSKQYIPLLQQHCNIHMFIQLINKTKVKLSFLKV